MSTGIPVGTVSCMKCSAPATIKMTFGAQGLGYACFEHADEFMRALAFENIKGGGTLEQTKQGYMRWRTQTGHPATEEEVDVWLSVPP